MPGEPARQESPESPQNTSERPSGPRRVSKSSGKQVALVAFDGDERPDDGSVLGVAVKKKPLPFYSQEEYCTQVLVPYFIVVSIFCFFSKPKPA